MIKWKEKPEKKEVEKIIKDFFILLKNGKLNEAKELVNHKHDDWESQIWSIWQDTYLIDLEEIGEEVEDDTFEGNLWKNDLNWLEQLSIEDKFHWTEDEVFVNIIYNNIVTDVSAEFSIDKKEDNYIVTKEIIHIA